VIDPVEFLQRYFVLESTGRPIVLEDWQKEYLHELFTGDYTLAVLSATKKVGKSTLAAGIALYVLFCWQSPVQVLFIANSREQSQTLAYRALVYSIEHSELSKSTTVYKRGRVVVDSTGAMAKVLPTKAPNVAGLSPSLIVWDEAWGLSSEDESLWTELTSIPTKRSLTLVVSYAGLEGRSPLLKRLYDLGVSEDKPSDMLFYWSTDPKLSSWVSDSYLESQRAKLLPHQYQRLFANQWVSAAGSFIEREQWDQCLDLDLKPLPPGSEDLVYLGLDCGLRRDSAVLCGVTREADQYSLALFKAWFPPPGDEIELEDIYEYLLTLHTEYNVSGVWFDPRFLNSIAQRLRVQGLNMIEVSPQPASVSRCYEFLYQVTKSQRLRCWDEPTLTQHVMNCAAIDGPVGIMLEKAHGRAAKIDGAVALALALWGASQAPPPKKLQVLRGMPESTRIQTPTSSRWVGDLNPRRHGLGRMKSIARMMNR
jgi:phage terminase large subunit-like protein